MIGFGIIVLALCLCSFCQNRDKKDIVATIDSFTLTKDNYNTFMEMRRYYPSATGDYFPGNQQGTALLLATMFLSEDEKASSLAGKLKSSQDWEWKQRYFPGQMYLSNVLAGNNGFTDKELQDYYKAHLDKFKTHMPLPSRAPDTAAKGKAPGSVKDIKKDMPKDTVIQKPFAECKAQIVSEMFLARYPAPDSLFRKHDPKDTAKIDSQAVRDRYMYSIRNTLPDFFMNKSYEQKFKHKLPDSLSQWYGKGKVITPEDMNVILHWLPEDQRSAYTTPAGTKDLAKWLLKWKLFTEDAKRSGYSSSDQIKHILEWAWKFEVAVNYVNSELAPVAKSSAAVDTSMCLYAMWDERNAVTKDTAALNKTVSDRIKKIISIKIDSMIYSLRKKHTVTFVGAEYKDDQSANPAALIAHADSLRDTGNTGDAMNTYRQLVTSFPFTPEGVRAYTELAKVQTEKGEYNDAIKNYRDFLVMSSDKSKRCNTFFMIGFIYDEYLHRSDIAEANYKWVLKNTPECELAEDAEFMTLHLGEPMNSVEELRAEAKRQGKKVDTSTPPDMPMDSGVKAKPDAGAKAKPAAPAKK
jgi:tetratricopeptide (TPR) repeat protein